MFDIVIIDSGDHVVEQAVNTIIGRTALIAVPGDGYRFIANNAVHVEGNGGTGKVLAIVGHANANSLSGTSSWSEFVSHVTAKTEPDWKTDKKTIYLVACSTAGKGNKFIYGNFANEIKKVFPDAVVWASTTAVNASDLSGNWIQV